MTTSDSVDLSQFDGCFVSVAEYSSALSGILRLYVDDADDNTWIVSFSECRYAQFVPDWKISTLAQSINDDGTVQCSDPAGRFLVVCERVHLISEEESWQANSDG